MRALGRLLALSVALSLGACASPTYLPREALLDPQTCATCHAPYVQDWSGSMHAYASDDPVFVAMNARGQRETNGALGGFCVGCHAPMAVREGATTDGLNLASVPQPLKGVTCFFCHSVASVDGAHDNPLSLATDETLRASFSDPVSNDAHRAGYSVLLDRSRLESASLCGACHDIVTPAGAAIERTYSEWQHSVYDMAPNGRTCGQCHMSESTTPMPIASAEGVFARRTHSHQFAAVDLALTAFPQADAQKQAVQSFLDSTLQSALCVATTGSTASLRVILDNVAAGHNWPSGAAQDRRAWIEIVAYQGGNVIYQSGVVPDGTPVGTASNDPDLWQLRDCMTDASGKPVDMFWQAANAQGNELPGQITFDMLNPDFYKTHIRQSFPATGMVTGVPDRVTLRVRLQPVGLDVLDDLVGSGDLAPSVRAAMGTFDVASSPILEWTAATATPDDYEEDGVVYSCASNTNLSGRSNSVPATSRGACGP